MCKKWWNWWRQSQSCLWWYIEMFTNGTKATKRFCNLDRHTPCNENKEISVSWLWLLFKVQLFLRNIFISWFRTDHFPRAFAIAPAEKVCATSTIRTEEVLVFLGWVFWNEHLSFWSDGWTWQPFSYRQGVHCSSLNPALLWFFNSISAQLHIFQNTLLARETPPPLHDKCHFEFPLFILP